MVNSPNTTAVVRNADETMLELRLGSSTRRSVDGQLAPRLRDASTNVRTSIALMPASIERYVNGSAITT